MSAIWAPPLEAFPALADDQVHVWRLLVDAATPQQAEWQRVLSRDELDRAGRFHFPRDQARYAITRGLTRTLLSCYLGGDAASIQFVYGDHGKPAFSATTDARGLRFNLTHSAGLALLAVSRGRDVGVDVEQVRSTRDALQIARRFFSAREGAALGEVPVEQRMEAFFNAWTRKEAVLKARGTGIAHGLDRVEVTLRPGEPAALLSLDGDAQEAAEWFLADLAPAPGFVGALAARGRGLRLACWQWAGGGRRP